MLALRLLMMLSTLPKAAQPSAILFLMSGSRSSSSVTVFPSKVYVTIKLLDGFSIDSNCALFDVLLEHYLGLAKMHFKARWFACIMNVSEHTGKLLW